MRLLSGLYSTSKKKFIRCGKFCLSLVCLLSVWYQCLFFRNISEVQHLYSKMSGECTLEEIDTIQREMKVFPVRKDKDGDESYAFEDGYGGVRTYGGRRKHQGIDIMTSNDKPGYFKIQSSTDGVIEQKGWLRLGGYRLGIRSDSGLYYYYAHMDSYAAWIKKGSRVHAGDWLGTMGNTGYGKKGTKGKFAVHLHFGIYRQKDGRETCLNPFYILEHLKKEEEEV